MFLFFYVLQNCLHGNKNMYVYDEESCSKNYNLHTRILLHCDINMEY